MLFWTSIVIFWSLDFKVALLIFKQVALENEVKHITLLSNKLLLKIVSLLYAVTVKLMPHNLLIYNILAEVETVDAVDKVIFRDKMAWAILYTLYTVNSILQILDNLLKTKYFVLS